MCDHYKDQNSKPHLTFAADLALLATTISLAWQMTTLDAIGTGFQLFCFSDTDVEAAQLRQLEVELMLAGTTNAMLANAREMLDVKVQLPPVDVSTWNLRQLQIRALSVYPATHPLHKYLEDHYNDIESFRPIWSNWRPNLHPQLMKAQGISI